MTSPAPYIPFSELAASLGILFLLAIGLVVGGGMAANMIGGEDASPKPQPLSIEVVGEWLKIQNNARTLHLRRKSVHGASVHEAGKGLANGFNHPVVFIHGGGKEFRLDVANRKEADLIVSAITRGDTN